MQAASQRKRVSCFAADFIPTFHRQERELHGLQFMHPKQPIPYISSSPTHRHTTCTASNSIHTLHLIVFNNIVNTSHFLVFTNDQQLTIHNAQYTQHLLLLVFNKINASRIIMFNNMLNNSYFLMFNTDQHLTLHDVLYTQQLILPYVQ